MAADMTIKSKKNGNGSGDMKISSGRKDGVFKKGKYWYQIYDDSGHMNEWFRLQQLRGNYVPTASNKPKGNSKTKTT